MIKFLYNIIATILSLFFYLKFRIKISKPNHGKRAKELLGFIPKIDYKKPLWFHTVSVGETLGALPLIKKLAKDYPNNNFIISTTTATAACLCSNLPNNVTHIYAPIDSYFCVKRYIKRLKPIGLIIMETELWPNLLEQAQKNNIQITIINARLSDRSANRYLKLLGQNFNKFIGNYISNIICQTDNDAKNFSLVGINEHKLKVFGSLKYDVTPKYDLIEKANQVKTKYFSNKFIICASSTHIGEDEIILQEFHKIKKVIPNSTLIIVPRHPERFNNVYELAKKQFNKTIMKSNLLDNNNDIDVIIGNTMGKMYFYFGLADLVFMAGSFIERGGHNPLEAASIYKCVLSGPHIFNFKDVYLKLKYLNAYVPVTQENFAETCIKLISTPENIKEFAQKAYDVVLANKGASEKTINFIREHYLD